MPNKLDKIRLPKDKDRRRKLNDKQKEKIKLLYKSGKTIRSIAREFDGICSRRMIQFVLFPNRMKHNAELFKQRRKDGRYYDKEKNRKAIASLRKYKKDLNLKIS